MPARDPWQPRASREPASNAVGGIAAAALVAAGGPALRVYPHGPNAQQGAVALVVLAAAAAVGATRPRWDLGRAACLAVAIAAALLVALPRIGRAPVLIVVAATPLAVRSLVGSLPGMWPRRGSLPAAALGVPPLVIAGVLWHRTGNQAATVAMLLFAAAAIILYDHNARRIERPLAALERWTSRIGKAAAAAILAIITLAVVYVPGAFGSVFARRRRRRPSQWHSAQLSTRATRRDASAPFSSLPAKTRYRRLGQGLAIAAALAAIIGLLRQPAPWATAATPAGNSPPVTDDAPIIFGREFAVPYSQLPAFSDAPWADELQMEEANVPDVDRRDGVHINIRDGRRVTAAPRACECVRKRVWVTGASSVWGIGQRDDQTIASYLATDGAEHGLELHVDNMGQRGTTFDDQIDMIERRLKSDPAPDLVIFVNGFNETGSAVASELVHTNPELAERFIAGGQQDLDQGDWLGHLDDVNGFAEQFLSADFGPAAGRVVVANVADAAKRMYRIAAEHGIQVLYFQQPDAHASRHQLEPYEVISNVPTDVMQASPLASALDYLETHLPQGVTSLRRVFDDEPSQVFLGLVHHNERGARRIAEAILTSIAATLPRSGGS